MTDLALHLDGWDTPTPGLTRSGSLYAFSPAQRVEAAHQLAAAGWWIHADVILRRRGAGVDPDAGVARDTLAAVRRELPAALLEVHVIDLAGNALDELLPEVLSARPDRVILPAPRCGTDDPAVRAVRDHGAQLWAESGTLPAAATPDGVLVMLIDAGTTQSVDLSRLAAVARAPSNVPVGVDGGVGREHTEEIVRAGARHLVSGRALLSRATDNSPADEASARTQESDA
ncbi:MAG: hypothetical protein ACRYF3_06165 [Janthinobacterium lividum]